ncbi:MAG: antibiotic biosynthesis monooxygenase [Akkermansiaceae bacterium]|nr:antibiotic biosynthesis monooxygenase [Armatimonadota bacterium]
MYVVVVQVKVKPGADSVARFESAIAANHLGTRQESGNLRFDVLKLATQSDAPDAPVEYLLYEVYNAQGDFEAHQRTTHYVQFRDAVEELMAEPRRGVRYVSVLPEPWL